MVLVITGPLDGSGLIFKFRTAESVLDAPMALIVTELELACVGTPPITPFVASMVSPGGKLLAL